MALILAIEPDRRQAARITALTRGPLAGIAVELVLTETAEHGIAALGERVPDLILTPQLLLPRDEAALSNRLRELDAAGLHVQTLMIPLLAGSTRRREEGGGLLSRLWSSKKGSAPDGCDPAVFAQQITEYLDRAAADRAARAALLEQIRSDEAAGRTTAAQEIAQPSPEDFNQAEWSPLNELMAPVAAAEPPAPVEAPAHVDPPLPVESAVPVGAPIETPAAIVAQADVDAASHVDAAESALAEPIAPPLDLDARVEHQLPAAAQPDAAAATSLDAVVLPDEVVETGADSFREEAPHFPEPFDDVESPGEEAPLGASADAGFDALLDIEPPSAVFGEEQSSVPAPLPLTARAVDDFVAPAAPPAAESAPPAAGEPLPDAEEEPWEEVTLEDDASQAPVRLDDEDVPSVVITAEQIDLAAFIAELEAVGRTIAPEPATSATAPPGNAVAEFALDTVVDAVPVELGSVAAPVDLTADLERFETELARIGEPATGDEPEPIREPREAPPVWAARPLWPALDGHEASSTIAAEWDTFDATLYLEPQPEPAADVDATEPEPADPEETSEREAPPAWAARAMWPELAGASADGTPDDEPGDEPEVSEFIEALEELETIEALRTETPVAAAEDPLDDFAEFLDEATADSGHDDSPDRAPVAAEARSSARADQELWMPLATSAPRPWPPLEGVVAEPAPRLPVLAPEPPPLAPAPPPPVHAAAVEPVLAAEPLPVPVAPPQPIRVLQPEFAPAETAPVGPPAPPPVQFVAPDPAPPVPAALVQPPPPAFEPEPVREPQTAQGPAAARQKKRREAAPVQDEWGFFDPEQCGFAALLAKLDEITTNDAKEAKP